MCVSGGDKGGVHNSTWQQVNTTGNGGSTWKKAGDCICSNGAKDYPTCTPPKPPAPAFTHQLVTGGWAVHNGQCGAGNVGYMYAYPSKSSWPDGYDSRFDEGSLTPQTINGAYVTTMYNQCGQTFSVQVSMSWELYKTFNFEYIMIAGLTYWRSNALVREDFEYDQTDTQGKVLQVNVLFAWRGPPDLKTYTPYEVTIK